MVVCIVYGFGKDKLVGRCEKELGGVLFYFITHFLYRF